jgi:cytidylate kinase
MEEGNRSFLLVAVGRTMGAGGSFVGRRLATRLGCRYLDRELLIEAAKRLHRDPEALEAFDERHLSFWERTRMAYAFGAADALYTPPPVTVDDMELFDSQKEILREAAGRGPVVVVGRAGFAVLRGEPGLLSVFLHAPLEVRAERIRKIYRLGSLAEAKEMVAESDKQREHFVRAASGLDWRDPNHYHLCVDTARLGTAATAELIYVAAMEVARNLERTEVESF